MNNVDLGKSFEKLKEDDIFNQMINISKASAYDILVKEFEKLKAENEKLKADRDVWKRTAIMANEILKLKEIVL